MKDLRLTADGDLDITSGRLSWVEGIEATVQRVTMRLRTFLGESVYNRAGGTPWRQVLFQRGITEFQAQAILYDLIRTTREVTAVRELVVTIDRVTRRMNVRGAITAGAEEASFDLEIAP